MKKLRLLTLLIVLFSALFGACSNESSKDEGKEKEDAASQNLKKIGIVQIVEHSSLDTIRLATIDKLKDLGYKDKENCLIDYKNATGDMNNLNSIVDIFKSDKKDIVIAIATPSAQAAANVSDEIPVIFSAVSDPVAAGLIKDAAKPDGNITGTSDAVAVDKILSLALDFVPDAKNVGMIYNSSEANSVSNKEKALKYCEENNLNLIEGAISNSSELKQTAEVLASKVDFIFTPNDNTVAAAMPALADVQVKLKVPVFVGADSMVKDGGLATYGIDYEALGHETAVMVDKVLKGTEIGEIPVKVFDEDLNIYVNEKIAKELGIAIPKNIKSNSKYVGIE